MKQFACTYQQLWSLWRFGGQIVNLDPLLRSDSWKMNCIFCSAMDRPCTLVESTVMVTLFALFWWAPSSFPFRWTILGALWSCLQFRSNLFLNSTWLALVWVNCLTDRFDLHLLLRGDAMWSSSELRPVIKLLLSRCFLYVPVRLTASSILAYSVNPFFAVGQTPTPCLFKSC